MKIIKEPNNGSYSLGISLRRSKDSKIYTLYCGLWCWHFMSWRTWYTTSMGLQSKDGIHFRKGGWKVVARKNYYTFPPDKLKYKYK